MRPMAGKILSYDALSTEEIAQRVGLRADEIIRFDGNTSPHLLPSTRAEALAAELARIHTYPHGGYPRLDEAIAHYAGVSTENIVLGAGADDLILLVTRAFAGPGERVAIANDPTYPMFQIAVWVAGAEIADEDPVLTICCRPNNPTGELGDLPEARPLVVDEAYFEYAGETAAGLIDDGVIVLRTFSKVFGLAGARVGYALAGRDVAVELNQRQHPAPLSTLSAALAIAALQTPPDVRPILEERERFAERLRGLGYEPLPSHANFLYVPVDYPEGIADQLLEQGLAVRPVRGGIRITIRNEQDDERLLRALQ
jgi:histidinol-phosphate/aromatic aminotransferase/cobyric acid decarboxylase-like protein